jgi:putative serine protease PepD
VSPAVVSVKTNEGSGTGFLIGADGKLVTNAHVVSGNSRVVVKFGPSGDSLDAAVVGVDVSSDLAVLSIEPASVPSGVKPLQFADSRNVQIGDPAIAIGNPFGLDRTATEGIVSGLGRHIQAPNGFAIDSVIQTDAPINPGNSGGPLLDTSGHVIGVNSQIATAGSSGNVGIGFAVPSNSVRQVVPKIEAGQAISRPFLGVSTGATPTGTGAVVSSVVPGGPADKAGLQPGDVIETIDGQPVADPSAVSTLVGARHAGDRMQVQVLRGGQSLSIGVRLGVRPAHVP